MWGAHSQKCALRGLDRVHFIGHRGLKKSGDMHEPMYEEEAECAGTTAEGPANPEHTLEMDTRRCVLQGVSHRESHTYNDSITTRGGPEISCHSSGMLCVWPSLDLVSMGSAKKTELGEAGVAGDTPPQWARMTRSRPGDPGSALIWGLFHQKHPFHDLCGGQTIPPSCRDQTQHKIMFYTKNYWGNRIFSITEFPTFLFL